MLNRATKLRIAQVAAQVHQQSGQRETALESGRLDIYRVIEALKIRLLFKPLDGLLGAYLPKPSPGVLITTNRSASIQRFTAAHELGHATLGHNPSLDDDSILRRMAHPSEQSGTQQEEEANYFATTFMLPTWLVNQHAARQQWKKLHLADPLNLYQLSLRVGLSYAATCVALRQHNLITSAVTDKAMKVVRKGLKKELLGDVEPVDFYRDVWKVTLADHNAIMEPQVGDHFVIELAENSGAGYRWELGGLEQSGATVLQDERAATSNEMVGSPVTRRVTVRWDECLEKTITIQHTRPWEDVSSAIESLSFFVHVGQKIGEGLSEQTRRQLLEAA